MTVTTGFTLNGRSVTVDVPATELLCDTLRERLYLTGTRTRGTCLAWSPSCPAGTSPATFPGLQPYDPACHDFETSGQKQA